MKKSSLIYIAGHNGLVGSAIVRRLQYEGYNNLVFTPHADYDLRNQQVVLDFFEKTRPEYVFLSAAKVGGILANTTKPADFLYDNLMIGCNIIQAAHNFKVKKLLFIGSSCIYPKLCPQPMKEEYLLSGYLEPTNEAYALAKISCLKMCQYYRKQHGDDFISAMPTNIYGKNDNFNLETSHVVPAIVRKFCLAKWLEDKEYEKIKQDLRTFDFETELNKHGIVHNKEQDTVTISFWGSGKARRELLHSDDLADALVFLMNNYSADDHINVGLGTDISINELVLMTKEIVGFQGKIDWDTSKPDGTPQKLLCIEKLNKMGWSAQIALYQGLKMMVEDYKDNL
jgi:GDP-L-fucose synthase